MYSGSRKGYCRVYSGFTEGLYKVYVGTERPFIGFTQGFKG